MAYSSDRSLTLGYTIALSIVAAMSLLSHLTLEGVIRSNEGAGAVINVSGRQRMLSQRIASLSAQVTLGIPGARETLKDSIVQFEQAHKTLVEGGGPQGFAPSSDPGLRALYFGGPHPLDTAVKEFIGLAREVTVLDAGDPSAAAVSRRIYDQADKPLLDALNEVVTFHQSASEAHLGTLKQLQTASLLVVIGTLVLEAMLIFRPMVDRLRRSMAELRLMASTDPLTGALNRRSFNDRLDLELGRSSRTGQTLSLMLLDADHFKAINDRYGHGVGDAVLRMIVTILKGSLRAADAVGRIGGEEFVVLMPDTTLAQAELVANRCRETIALNRVPTSKSAVGVTVSIGVDVVQLEPRAFEAVLVRADTALYAAKAGGRNQVRVVAPPEPVAAAARPDPEVERTFSPGVA